MGKSLFRHLRLSRLVSSAIAGAVALAPAIALSAETKTYVVDWFYMANYFGDKSDCPKGLNPSSVEFYRRDFLAMGKPKEEVDRLLDGFPGPGSGPWSPVAIIRGNGKDNVYENPATETDPGNFPIEGHFAYGFNLDGRGAASPNSFEDPETHEKGINNELYRTVGCIRSYRPNGPGLRPVFSEYVWDILRDRMPAWLVTVTRDGDGATVTFDRALTTVTRDATGAHPRANMTYQADSNPRAHHVVHGKFINDVLVTEPADINFMGDDFGLASDLSFRGARMRFKMNPDGSLKGIIGGYQRWVHTYFAVASRGFSNEYVHSQDSASMYYALKRAADANPDPKTGENRDISAAYAMEAIPAMITPAPPVSKARQPMKVVASDAPLATPRGITLQMTVAKPKAAAVDKTDKDAAKETKPKEVAPAMVYANAAGMSLYAFDMDKADAATCTGDCAQMWPPALAPKNAKAAGEWSLSKRPDGTKQWVLKGQRLYTFSKDTAIGETNGLGVDSAWHPAAFKPDQGELTPNGIHVAEVDSASGIALVNDLGMPLYTFSGNAVRDKTACVSGPCTNHWIPVVAGQFSTTVGDFTAVQQAGLSQWAYKGKPLYTFDGDTQPGDAVGGTVDARWQVALVSKYFMPANVVVQRNHYEGFNLATADGMTIYQHDRFRSMNGGHSVRLGIKGHPSLGRIFGTADCTGNCLKDWRPLIAPAKAQPSGRWEIATREDGTRQWVYQGYAVYTFAGDKAAGDMNGNEMLEYVGHYAGVEDPFSIAESGEIYAGPGFVGGISGRAAPAMVWHSVLP